MAKFKMNVERTLNAFTSGTYQVHEAMYEFADNSEAADAKKVHIIVEKGNKEPVEKIIVSDDGSGMSAGELEASLEFAGEIRERGNFEVSEFGVGMKAAAFSLADHFTVITKSCNGNISGAFLDRERINTDQEFEGPQDTPTRNYDELWEQYAVDKDSTGTIILLENLLQTTYGTCKAFIGRQADSSGKNGNSGIRHNERLATRYRAAIDSGRLKIYTINGRRGLPTLLNSYDPLKRNEEDTERLIEQTVHWPKRDANFDFILTRVSNENSSLSDFGFYVTVAGTTICKDSNRLFGIYKQNSSHSYRWPLRGEIVFATKDEFLKVMNFTSHKHEVQIIDESFGDWLRDNDIGRAVVAETNLRMQQAQVEKIAKSRLAFQDANDKFVEALNTEKNIYGASHTFLKHFGQIKGLKAGLFEARSDIARLEKGVIVYNPSHPQLSALLKNKAAANFRDHQAARALATVAALQNEEEHTSINFYEYHSIMSNLLSMHI